MKTTPPLTGSVSIFVPPKIKVLPERYRSLQKTDSEPRLNVFEAFGIILPAMVISPVILPPLVESLVLLEVKAALA